MSIEAASGQRAVRGGAGSPRAAARAGMGFRGMVVTALAALLLCGASLAAPAAGGAGGDMPRDMGGGSDAAGLEEELHVGAAELAAVPAESRAVLAKVLGRLEGLRGEMEELKENSHSVVLGQMAAGGGAAGAGGRGAGAVGA